MSPITLCSSDVNLLYGITDILYQSAREGLVGSLETIYIVTEGDYTHHLSMSRDELLLPSQKDLEA